MESFAEQLKLAEIFFPHASKNIRSVQENNTRFVHYTSAEAAINIIRSKEVWMRKSSYMNDYMEVTHGLECLKQAYNNTASADKLTKFIDSIYPNLTNEINTLFNGWLPHFESETFVTSVSEHLDNEDKLGRLSMWRAYGNSVGVALVLNNTPFLSPSNALNAYTSPVAYLTNDQFSQEFSNVVNNICRHQQVIEMIGRDATKSYLFNAYKFAILCTKHPGFWEEREWRVIHSPTIEKSDRIRKDIEIIRGTPQSIYKIPLQNYPDEGLEGAEVHEILNRVIIGPADFPGAMVDVFSDLLSEAGITDPMSRIEVSDIPLRQ